jgi:hypothetical protein
MSISSTRLSNGVAGFAAQLRKGWQIDDDQIDKADAVRLERREIVRRLRREDTAVEPRRVLTRPSTFRKP